MIVTLHNIYLTTNTCRIRLVLHPVPSPEPLHEYLLGLRHSPRLASSQHLTALESAVALSIYGE